MRKGQRQTETAKENIRFGMLGKHNGLRTEFKKGHGEFKGMHHTKKTKEEISETMKTLFKEGKKIPFFCTKDGRMVFSNRKLRVDMKGKHNGLRTEFKKGRKFSKEIEEKMIRNTLSAMFKRPTKLEQKLIGFIEEYNLPFKYCGDGSLIIGGKNPDFVENDGRKICLEIGNKEEKSISRKGRNYNSWQEYEKQRIEHFAKYGWKCIVIWENELSEQEILSDKMNLKGGD